MQTNFFELGQNYSYEPYVKTKTNPYFPDFKINKFIIECTMWKGHQKAYPLAKKILNLEREGYTVKVVIPDNLTHFYKPIERYIVSIFELERYLPK